MTFTEEYNKEFTEESFTEIETDTQEISDKMPPDYDGNGEETSPAWVKEAFDWLEVVVTALIAVVLIFSFVFRVATIDGPSMQDTLFKDEKVIITNFAYKPKVGDIVVISRNKSNSLSVESEVPIIKRIIATEGQVVDIDFVEGKVYVDGVEEKFVDVPTNLKYDITFPVTVDEDCVFVLGDNRNDSLDSRASWIGNNGMIDTRYILGHAVFRIYPFNRIGGID